MTATSGSELIAPGARLVEAASGESVGGPALLERVAAVARALAALPPGA